MDVPCPACLSLPTGVAGHEDLRVQGMGNSRMSFECSRCGSLWSRVAKPGTSNEFTWFGLNEQAVPRMALGNLVPPRSDPAPVFQAWPRNATTPDKADR